MQLDPAFVGIDWGTTSFRAYLLSNDAVVIDRVVACSGILQIGRKSFHDVLEQHCGSWLKSDPGLPVLMCGMIGSQQGWINAGYVSGLSGVRELAAAITSISKRDAVLYVIPGIRCEDFNGNPEIMRGEETILAGAISSGAPPNALYCLPGTHSKWVSVINGRIAAFATFVTGELYALLTRNSILSSLMELPRRGTQEIRARSFTRGLELAASDANLLHQVFTIRALVLAEGQGAVHVGEMLSGLLIGTELVATARCNTGHGQSVNLVASGELADRYQKALRETSWNVTNIDSEAACIAGLHAIAEGAGTLVRTAAEARGARKGD